MRKKIAIGLIVLALALIGIGIFLGIKEQAEEIETVNHELYLLPNASEKYAVFNSAAEQLSEFLYDGVALFYKHGVVLNQGEKQVLMTNEGKVLLDAEAMSKHTLFGPFYYETEASEKVVRNFKGEVVDLSIPSANVYNYSKDFVLINKGKEYAFYDVDGEELLSFPVETTSSIYVQSKDDLIYLVHGDDQYLYDLKSKEKLIEKNEKEQICNWNKAGDLVVFNYCEKLESFYVYYDNKELYKIDAETCQYRILDDRLYCVSQKDDEPIIKLETSGHAYAKQTLEGVEIYRSSKLLDTIKGANLINRENLSDVYSLAIKDGEAEKYLFYDLDAKQVLSDKYVISNGFDISGNAVVAEKSREEYLIDAKGKTISSKYDYIMTIADSDLAFYVAHKGNSVSILSTAGKEVYSSEHPNYVTDKTAQRTLFVFYNEDSDKVNIVNPEVGLVIENQEAKIDSNFLSYDEEGKKTYYNLKGQKLASIETK